MYVDIGAVRSQINVEVARRKQGADECKEWEDLGNALSHLETHFGLRKLTLAQGTRLRHIGAMLRRLENPPVGHYDHFNVSWEMTIRFLQEEFGLPPDLEDMIHRGLPEHTGLAERLTLVREALEALCELGQRENENDHSLL